MAINFQENNFYNSNFCKWINTFETKKSKTAFARDEAFFWRE